MGDYQREIDEAEAEARRLAEMTPEERIKCFAQHDQGFAADLSVVLTAATKRAEKAEKLLDEKRRAYTAAENRENHALRTRDRLRKACDVLEAENERLREALADLTNNVAACWGLEGSAREAFGNTNYTAVQQRIERARVALAAQEPREPGLSQLSVRTPSYEGKPTFPG